MVGPLWWRDLSSPEIADLELLMVPSDSFRPFLFFLFSFSRVRAAAN